jgi:hypothetical protein
MQMRGIFIETRNQKVRKTIEHIPTDFSIWPNHVKRRNVAIFFLFHPKTKGRIALGPYDSYSGLLSLENAH